MISASDIRSAMSCMGTLLPRSPLRNSLSCSSMYDENCPDRRGYWPGMPAPAAP
ncbi:Uncharacterised protein [Bordetella pertussis]|nr:Uncharacterised protein [Bordetella pertussis]